MDAEYHIKQIVERHHQETDHHGEYCAECCGPPFPCPDRVDALAALEQIKLFAIELAGSIKDMSDHITDLEQEIELLNLRSEK